MKINLHIGAHKTATTFLQEKLSANLASLHRAGIGYLSLTEFRQHFTSKLENHVAAGAHIDQFLPKFFSDTSPPSSPRLILSDENLVGSCADITNKGAPLISGPKRLKLLQTFLSGHQVTMFFAIRSYDTFIASAYCEALRSSPQFVDFPTVKSRLQSKAFDWASIIDTFCESLRPEAVRIWRFEDFRRQPGQVASAIAHDLESLPEEAGASSRRPSFSQSDIDKLHDVARTNGVDAARQMIRELGNQPRQADHHNFYPWANDEKHQWESKYSTDCERINKSYWLPI